MNYKLVEKSAFAIVGKSIKTNGKNGENLKEIPLFWNQVMKDGTFEKLLPASGELGVMGACVDFNDETSELTYMIAIEDSDKAPRDLERAEIPASNWAVFEAIGPMPDAIQKVWKDIYTEWFPSSQYQHAGTAELEIYSNADGNASDYKSEVWIPVKSK